MVEDGVVFTEFKAIPSGRASPSGELFFKDSTGLRDVKGVFPYADNRVKVACTAANPDGYINASLLKVGRLLVGFVRG